MNSSVAIVIVGDEKNVSLPWTSEFPTVLLTDELAASNDQSYDKCNYFGRVATRGTVYHVIAVVDVRCSSSEFLRVFNGEAVVWTFFCERGMTLSDEVNVQNVGCQKRHILENVAIAMHCNLRPQL